MSTYNVKVKLFQKENKITILDNNSLMIYLNAKPKNNEANKLLISLLEEHFQQKIYIISGHHKATKIIKITTK